MAFCRPHARPWPCASCFYAVRCGCASGPPRFAVLCPRCGPEIVPALVCSVPHGEATAVCPALNPGLSDLVTQERPATLAWVASYLEGVLDTLALAGPGSPGRVTALCDARAAARPAAPPRREQKDEQA